MERVPSPIRFTEDDMAVVRFGVDGLVPAVVQDAGDGTVLMLGLHGRRGVAPDPADRALVVLEPQPR